MASLFPQRLRFLPFLVLLGLLSSSVFAGTWTVQPWTGDASTGIVNGETQWAYHFGSATAATVNGVSVPGFAGPPPVNVANHLDLTGAQFVLTPDTNQLTNLGGTGSAILGSSFFYGGVPSTNLTIKAASLQPGSNYLVSLLSVGWDGPPDQRLIKFVSGTDELAIDQNLYGNDFGLRADYTFTAGAGDQVLRVDMNNPDNRTFHIYALALKRVAIHTNVALTSNNNPSLPGSSVTFTATVTPVSGGGIPTGSVVFKDGTTTLDTVALNASGVATFTTSSLSQASHSITATYGGDVTYFDKVSPVLTQVVSKMNTTTALISSANPALPGASVTFTATVTPFSGGGTPTGNVVFKDGAATLNTVPLTGGVATYTTSALAAGIHSITATYNGSSLYNTSVSDALNQSIAGTFTVTTAASAGGGSLAQVITDATPGSFVVFQAGLAGKVLTLPASEIILDKDLTIDASALAGGVILQGEGVNRLFYIAAGRTVIFKNLTLAGGGGVGATNSDRGGAVLNAGTLVAEDCVFTGSKGAFGGALATGYSTASASLTLRRCWIFDNVATGSGGGIILTANTASLTATLQMEECSVEGNRAGVAGGGLYCQSASVGSTITASLRQCTFRGNTAGADGGGAIFSRANGTSGTSAANLTLVHCTLTDNTARFGGGVATVTDFGCPASLSLTGSIIAGNHSPSAVDVGRQGGTFTSGGGNLIGSATLSHITTWAASDLTGTDAAPLDARLASLGFYGGPVPTCPPLPGSPALDAAANAPPTATDQRGLPRVLDADGAGGAVADSGAVESVFAQVDVADDELDVPAGANDVSIREALRDAPAGAILTFAPGLSGQTFTLNDTLGSLVVTKDAGLDASSLQPGGFTLRRTGTNRLLVVNAGVGLTLNHLTLSGPGESTPASGGGGGIQSTGRLSLNRCRVTSHSALGNGGGISSSGLLSLRQTTLGQNTAATGSGGALHVLSGLARLDACTLSGNKAADGGGGLFVLKGLASLSQCTVSSNTSFDPASGGGGLGVGAGGGARLSHSTVTGNTAENGGGLYLENAAKLSLANSLVAGNTGTVAASGPDIHAPTGTVLRTGGSILGKNLTVETAFPAGAPNANGDYVGTTAAPVAALLGPLADNGGPTQTCLPQAGSPAIDHATANLAPLLDARGFPRNKDGDGDFTFVPDIGATEFGTDPVLVVNTLADELDTPTAGASLSLREALRQAPAGAVITFAPALNGQTLVMDSAKGCFTPDHSVTVDASSLPAGLTLDAGTGDDRHVVMITGAHLAFNRITFTSGGGGTGTAEAGQGSGGSFYLFYGNLVLTDCTLRDNTATIQGGAIMQVNNNCRLVMSRCTLHRNKVLPGAGQRNGGALAANNGLVDLDHCTFTANQTPTYGGAGFFFNTQMEVNHCTITGNNAASGGVSGILFLNGPPDRVRVSNSLFCGNSDAVDLYVDNGTLLSGGGNVGGGIVPLFDQPTDTNGTTPAQLNLAELGRYGGLTDTMPPLPNSPALDRAAGSTATADQRGFTCPVDGNFDSNAVADSGAAESFVVRLSSLSDQLDTPAGPQVSLREAVRDAPVGAVLAALDFNGTNAYLSRGELVVDKSLILAGGSANRIRVGHTDTRALHILPGVCFHVSRADFEGSTIYDNNGVIIGYSAGLGAVESGKGGAILNQGTLILADCTLNTNGASQGGAIANGMVATPSRLTLKRCTLSGNQATTQGGAIFNSATGGGAATVELENCLIYGNTSLRHGGTVASSSGSGPATLTALHCTVMQNKATTSGGGFYSSQGTGAATTTLTSCIVAGNTAPTGPDVQRASGTVTSGGPNLIGVGDSGGVTWAGTDLTGTLAVPLSPQVSLETNAFLPLPGSPVLDAAGATTVLLDRNRQPRVVDGNFTGGAQPDIGAVEAPAVLVTTAADELDTPAGANVSLREALRDAPNGAIIRVNDALNGQTLTLNSSLGQIGNFSKSFTVDAGHLAAGFTLDAGGASRIFQFTNSSAVVHLRGLTLKNGKITGNGGAILNGARLTLENCWLTGNSVTSGSGGAVGTDSISGPIIMQGCTFTDNSATFRGGAVSLEAGFFQHQVTQCTFSGNRCGSRGGGLYVANYDVKISQSTFTGNEATGTRGGGVVFSGSAALDNCIIAGNRAPASPDLVMDSGTITRTGVNIIGVAPATGTPVPSGLPNANGDYVGTSASPLNALVAPVGLYGGRTPTCPPMPGSPALDRATGNTSTTDQRGLTRSVDGDLNGTALPDIGAAESVIVRVDVADDELDTPAGTNDVSLREALRDAPEGAVIGFAPNLAGLTLALGASGLLVPPRSVIISASGLAAPVTLTPQAGNHIFYLPSQRSLGLSHLNLTGANVPGANGAAIASDGSLSLSDCSLTANSTTSDGGAVASQGPSLAVNRCVFSGNQAANGGALVLLSFGPSVNPRLTVEDSVFQTNSCPSRGGAISHYSQGGGSCQTTVRRSLFTGNQAFAGGALHLWANGGRSEVMLESCTFSGNQVSNGGGAVYPLVTNQGTATTTLNQCTLHQNSMPSDGAVVGLADAAGSSSQMRLNRCTLAGNTTTGSGGAVAALGFSGAVSSITLDGCIIAGNSTAGASPEVVASGSGTIASLGNNLIGKADGGGVTWQDTDLTGTIAAPLNAMLASLGDYGGPTQTMPPLPGSPARDPESGATTAPLFPLNVDQRGQPRLQGAKVDIGAVEAGAADAPGTLAFGGPVVRVNEGANPGLIPVFRSAGSIGTLTVKATSSTSSGAGFASSPGDFTAVTDFLLTFLPGETVKNVEIPIVADPLIKEPHENFTLTLTDVTGGGSLGAQSTTTVRILDSVDASVPTLTLLTPKAGAIFTAAQGPQIAVTGSAKDDKGIQAVQVQLNGGAFVDAALLPAVPGTNPTFSLGVNAVPGVNNLVVRSVDEKGKTSALTKRSFTYRVTSVLTVNVPLVFDSVTNTSVVGGTVTLPVSVDKNVPKTYYVGMPYKVTATPKPGYVFRSWSVNLFSSTGITQFTLELPSLAFIMQPGLVLTANFGRTSITPEITGTYSGLILPSAISPAPSGTPPGNANTGLFTLTLGSTGVISGSLKVDGASLPFSATMTHGAAVRFGTGAARTDTLRILRKGKPDLELGFYLTTNPSRMNGTLTQKQGTTILAVSNIIADRAHYSSKSKVPTSLVTGTSQRFNLTFPSVPGQAAASAYPPGTGIGSLILGSDGSAKFAGTLADNTGFTASGALSATNQAPLFVSLYTNKGHIAGNVSVVPPSNPGYDTFGVNYLWNRPQQTKVQWYPNGWPTGINLDMVGAKYLVPLASANQSVIPGLGPVDLTNTVGNATLTFMDGLLGSVRNYPVNITTKDAVTILPLKTKDFTLTLTKATGEISGAFTHTDGKKPAFKGTTLQKPGDYQGTYGFFMSVPPNATSTSGQGGSVMLLPGAMVAP